MRKNALSVLFLLIAVSVTGCGGRQAGQDISNLKTKESLTDSTESIFQAAEGIEQLEDGFSAVRYDGSYGFDIFHSS